MDWTTKRLARYAKWRAKVGYYDMRRRAGVAYAQLAFWMPTGNPDFLGIGAPRSASTWLYKRLSLHPRVCLSKRKEIHFFDVQEGKGTYVYGPDARRPGLHPLDVGNPRHWRWYLGHFGKCGDRVSGEITPDYSLLENDRIGVIKSHLPDLKLIYAMRNPTTRAWSSVRKELWWRFGMHPQDVPDVGTLVRMAMRPGVLARGDYKSAILRWETHFKGQILYLFYDDILENPREVLHLVCDFLGVDRAPLDVAGGHSTRVNDVPAGDIPLEVRDELEQYYAPQLPFLTEKFGRSFSHWCSGSAQAGVTSDVKVCSDARVPGSGGGDQGSSSAKTVGAGLGLSVSE
jgi:hypothetical protein